MDLECLLDRRIEAKHYLGETWTGKLVGYYEQPTVIIERDDGSRVTAAISVFKAIGVASDA